jgi:aspartate aminotransferase-like enzyme
MLVSNVCKQAISAVIRELAPRALIVVDGVCSVGGEELEVGAWLVSSIRVTGME